MGTQEWSGEIGGVNPSAKGVDAFPGSPALLLISIQADRTKSEVFDKLIPCQIGQGSLLHLD